MRSPIDQAALLHDRGFCYLLVGHFLSALAPMTQRAAVLLWVYALTGSGTAVGLVGVAEGLALVGVAPFAGVLVDRWDRARTMAGVVLAQAALLLPLLGVRDVGGLPVLLAVTLLVNAASQLFLPRPRPRSPSWWDGSGSGRRTDCSRRPPASSSSPRRPWPWAPSSPSAPVDWWRR